MPVCVRFVVVDFRVNPLCTKFGTNPVKSYDSSKFWTGSSPVRQKRFQSGFIENPSTSQPWRARADEPLRFCLHRWRRRQTPYWSAVYQALFEVFTALSKNCVDILTSPKHITINAAVCNKALRLAVRCSQVYSFPKQESTTAQRDDFYFTFAFSALRFAVQCFVVLALW
jgi:hypothetical protein